MTGKQGFIIMTLATLLCLSLPLAITSIVLSQNQHDVCDFKDRMGLDVRHYLLGKLILIEIIYWSNILQNTSTHFD